MSLSLKTTCLAASPSLFIAVIADLRVPPSNRLEKLKGDLSGFLSFRIDDQWRIIFKWLNGEPHAVPIIDYH